MPLAGDASFRKYERIFLGGKQVVLMDAPPDKEDIRPFMKIAGHLLNAGMSAPQILASDTTQGLLLLEDLGDGLFARALHKAPGLEEELYLAAADVLVDLYHQAAHTKYHDVPVYDMKRFLQQVALVPEWFLPLITGAEQSEALKEEYLDLWRALLACLPDIRQVLILYDFHAENLLWLPEREGARRVGLLDFQDAVMGSPAYDMVSFLEDARRDVAPQTVARIIEYYLKRTSIPRDDFMLAYAMIGAQRNCRIVGTFARLAVRDGKPHYLNYLPRVWRHLEHDLKHPLLAPLKAWIDANVPHQWRGALVLDDTKMRATV